MKRILGLDVGTKRTGIAVSDPLGLTARLTTVAAQRSLLAGNVRRDKRRTVVDQLAAVLILQGYLNAIAQKEGVDNGKATGTGTAK